MGVLIGRKGQVSLNKSNVVFSSGKYSLSPVIQPFDLGSPSGPFNNGELSTNTVTLNVSNGPSVIYVTVSSETLSGGVDNTFLYFNNNSFTNYIYNWSFGATYGTRTLTVNNGDSLFLRYQFSSFLPSGNSAVLTFEIRQNNASGTILDTGTFTAS